MSLAYSQQSQQTANPGGGRGGNPPNRGQGPPPSSMHIQKILDENAGLIQTIQDFQYTGKSSESMSYQVALHRNLVYLANLADPQQNVSSLLPVCVARTLQPQQCACGAF
uniref:SS18 N-terminal domain-containing protein n=1 Tax=Anopheles maculatus TaxID=74869 RepID=A0A182SCW7_9DIPT